MTVPHYGKREPGLLTAASPGDTLYFAFASYNDSGDSEVLTGLAVTDIEVIKNGAATVRATDSGYSLISDTGMVGDRAGLYRCSVQLFNTADDASFYASGAWYQAFVDAVTIDGRTVRFWLGSFEIGRQRVDVRELIGDTGAANWLQQTYAAGFADTGINQRFAQIQSDVDTGLRVHIDDSDTGLKDVIADLDTGLRDYIDNTDTGLRKFVDNLDTGIKDRFNKLAEDTGGVNINSIQGDTGAAGWLRAAFATGFNDTGITNRFDRIQSEVDTGLRVHIDDLDTGLHDTIADLDTGLRDFIDNADTGLRKFIDNLDTGIKNRFDDLAEDTGGVNINAIQGDTGAAGWLRAAFATGFTDTGLNERLARIQSDVDTGLRTHIDDLDTGLHAHISDVDTGLHDTLSDYDTGMRELIADLDTGLRDYIDNTDTGLRAILQTTGVNVTQIDSDTGAADRLGKFAGDKLSSAGMVDTGTLAGTKAGTIDSNITHVNETAVQGTGAPGNEWRP